MNSRKEENNTGILIWISKFFFAKKRNIQHMQQKNIDELHKNVQYLFGKEFRA